MEIRIITKNRGKMTGIWQAFLMILKVVLDWLKQNWMLLPEIVIAIAAFALAYRSFEHEKEEIRKNLFKLADHILAGNYAELSRRAGKFYSAQFDQENDDNLIVEHLIYKKDCWIDDFAQGLRKIDSIKINYDPDRVFSNGNPMPEKLFQSKLKRILPDPDFSLVENSLMYLDKSIWDHPTFMVKQVVEGNSQDGDSPNILGIDVYLDCYYDFYNTCLGLGYLESFESVKKKRRSSVNAVRAKLPLQDYSNRYCTLGVVTFTVVKGLVGGTKFLLHSRSTQVAEGRGLINAVPAGSLQPSSTPDKLTKSDISQAVKLNIIRETGEELFGHDEFTDCFSTETIETNTLARIMADKLFYLGIGINPLNTYLEMLTLSVIDVNDSETRTFITSGIGNGKAHKETLDSANFMESLRKNEEGDISIRDFNKPTLESYAAMYNAAPAFAQIAKILSENFDLIDDFIENKI